MDYKQLLQMDDDDYDNKRQSAFGAKVQNTHNNFPSKRSNLFPRCMRNVNISLTTKQK